MQVRELMSRQVVTIGTGDSCLEAVTRMQRSRVRHLPVVSREGPLVGIVTDRDLRHHLFTPRIFLQSLMQYNNQARVWTANARFAWLSTAGTGLFIVYNDGETADGFFRWTAPQSHSLVVKFTRQLGTGG